MFLCTVVMVGTATMTKKGTTDQETLTHANQEIHHESRRNGIWFVVAGYSQFSDIHPVRFQFFQTGDCTRLAHFWGICLVHCGPVRGDVWLSANDIPAVGLVADPFSQS